MMTKAKNQKLTPEQPKTTVWGIKADGSRIELKNDCGCITHHGPHEWHMLEFDKAELSKLQKQVVELAEDRNPQAFALARVVGQTGVQYCQDKLRFFRKYGIDRVEVAN